MKVFRVLFPQVIGLFCPLMAAFIAGCATAPNLPAGKTSQPAAIPAVPPVHNEQPKPPVAEQPRRPAPAPVETSAPIKPEAAPTVATQPPVPKVQYARIVGTQESSILFDNFTAFITAIDGRKIAVGRDGWNVPLEIETGHRTLNVEFNRGVFLAKGRLEFDAVANAHYELKFKTDAEVFGNNSYCNFWVIDTATGKTVSMISKDSVEKIAEASAR